MIRISKGVSFAVAATAVLLLATSGLMAAPADCVPTAGLKQVPVLVDGQYNLTITTPNTYSQCPTTSCCDTITVSGIPAGHKVTGAIVSSFVFTTMCVDGQPAYPPQGRKELETIDLDETPVGGVVEIKVCYPKAHDWPSFETHVDLFMDLTLISNEAVSVPIIGSGTDWDTFCKTVGCTPGKWKNWTGLKRQADLWPLPYESGNDGTATLFSTAFQGAIALNKPNMTMLEGLQTGGGGEKAMVRHCTAALLNAAWVEAQPWAGNNCQLFADGTPSVATVIEWVNDALDANGETFESAHQKCAAVNESLCALDDIWLSTDNGRSECAADDPGQACNP